MNNKYAAIVEALKVGMSSLYSEPNKFPTIPYSEDYLVEIERSVNHALPADYRDFLQYLNTYPEFVFSRVHYPFEEDGYRTEGTLFIFYSRPDVDYQAALVNCDPLPIEYFPGLALVRDLGELEEIGWPKELLPIATDKGGNAVCLALFGLRPGAIFFWRDSPMENFQNLYLIADSFDEFMHLLYRPEN